MGAWTTQVIHHSVKLGLFEALCAGPQSGSSVANLVGCAREPVFRLLRALASLGMATHLDGDLFELTSDGRFMCRAAPGSLHGIALHWGDRIWKSFESLGQSVVSGRPTMATDPADFVAMQGDPARAAVFNLAMAEQSLSVGREVAEAYDFSRFYLVMDVGGGYGAVLRALLERYPALQGAVLDLPMLEEAAMAYLDNAGVANRAEYSGGNFFESVPSGADAYLLKYVLHDWGNAEATQILTNCRRALRGDGRVFLIEQIVPERIRPSSVDQATVRADLIMMTVGGRERTAREYRDLCGSAGLSIERIVPTPSGFSLIETKCG